MEPQRLCTIVIRNGITCYPCSPPLPGTRQIFDVTLDLVQTSCGMSVPNYTYNGDRELLNNWAKKKGEEGLSHYWRDKNQVSIDGIPTNIFSRKS